MVTTRYFPLYQEKIGIASFDYALAILIDLTGSGEIRQKWESEVDEKHYFRNRIFVRLISPH
jgi:hypothetical protein